VTDLIHGKRDISQSLFENMHKFTKYHGRIVENSLKFHVPYSYVIVLQDYLFVFYSTHILCDELSELSAARCSGTLVNKVVCFRLSVTFIYRAWSTGRTVYICWISSNVITRIIRSALFRTLESQHQ